jgi:hypothetical protein
MTAAKNVLTDAQRELLTQVLDRIVPADGGLPGAGELGVGEFVEGAAGSKPGQTRQLVDGLKLVEVTRGRHGSEAFGELDDDARDQVLRTVESESPAFFDELVRLTYVGYYSQPRVAAALGLEARPPQPLGFELEQADLSSLDNVRQRGPVYREA